jgi:hypothetical protein
MCSAAYDHFRYRIIIIISSVFMCVFLAKKVFMCVLTSTVLPPFLIINYFYFLKYINFIMHVDMSRYIFSKGSIF